MQCRCLESGFEIIHHFCFVCFDGTLLNQICFKIFCKCRRTRDELAKQNAETSDLTNKLDRVSILNEQTRKQNLDGIDAMGLSLILLLLSV